jgi:hypothetical protein
MAQESEDFTDVIERAQRTSNDLSGMFAPNGPGRVAFQPRGNRVAPEQDFEAHAAVFVLPNDSLAYEEVLNEVLLGTAIIRYEDRTFTKDGDFMVAVCYLTPRVRAAAAPVDDQDAGDAEPAVRPRRLP